MSFSVVIPSKTASNLKACVAAVRKHEPDLPGHKIIVVDDGIKWFEMGLTWIDSAPVTCDYYTIKGVKPFVFARNCNLGIRTADDDDVILLNDDALLETPAGFTSMSEIAVSHPEIGIIGATCNNVGNPNQHRQNVGLRPEPRMVCFVCVYIPRRTIDKVGLLDEEFVGYGLDDDAYSLEVRKAGLKIGIHDGCYVSHDKLPSSYRGDPKTPSDFRPNMQRFIDKYGCDNWGLPAEQARRKWRVA